jgi:hypothetical protein
MMSLYDKIIALYPSLTVEDFIPYGSVIGLRNDSDGNGDYIEKWEHPTLPRPTNEQLGL